MNFMKQWCGAIIAVMSGGAVFATEPPATIDVKGKDAALISSSVIPIPLEVFTALDKLGAQDWDSQLEKRDFNPSPDRSRSALLFGLAISQGFLAVQAKNDAEVKRVGMAVQRLAHPLGVESPVEKRIKVIMESLSDKNWNEVKQEFDKTRQTVLKEMKVMRDEDLTSLVALGGWLGGTGALSSILKENYSPEGSDLLNQAGLLMQLKADFQKLPEGIKSDEIFAKIDATLNTLEKLMENSGTGIFTLAEVSKIHDETHHLLDAIYQD
ncbi:MAG: hypothetical protein P1U89_00165 [Verrucomicrobiales bacterium]|nr:hypothetical protein [Verrucomicrobiales bacterium]